MRQQGRYSRRPSAIGRVEMRCARWCAIEPAPITARCSHTGSKGIWPIDAPQKYSTGHLDVARFLTHTFPRKLIHSWRGNIMRRTRKETARFLTDNGYPITWKNLQK